MTNGSGRHNYDQDINVLSNRVGTLERGQRDLSGDITTLGSRFEKALEASTKSMDDRLDLLSTKIEERSKIPWPALGVMLTFVCVIGGMAYYPIQTTQGRIEATLLRFDERFVTNKDLETRLSATAQRRDDFQRLTEARFERIESDVVMARREIVPRAEHTEKWRGADLQREGLQRQIEEIERQFGDTFSLRDALVQMQKRIDTLEGQRGTPRS